MSESKDEDLLKIQIVSEHYHAIFTNRSSLIIGALIAFLVLFYTLLYNETFSPLTFWLTYGSFSVACIFFILKINKDHHRDLTKISNMIEKVKKGEELPTLKELVTSEKDEKESKIQTKQGEMSNNEDNWKKRLESFVDRIDDECKKKRLFKDWVAMALWLVGLSTFAFLLIMWVNLSNIITSSFNEVPQDVEGIKFFVEQLFSFTGFTVSIPALTFTIAAVVIGMPKTTRKDLTTHYYKKLSKDYDVDTIYLKALINMKCKNFDIPLRQVYEESIRVNSDLFSKDSLIESLYSESD